MGPINAPLAPFIHSHCLTNNAVWRLNMGSMGQQQNASKKLAQTITKNPKLMSLQSYKSIPVNTNSCN